MEPNVSPCVPSGPQGSELSSWGTSVISAQDLLKVKSKWSNPIFCSKYFSLGGSGRFWNVPVVAVTQGSSLNQFSGEQLQELSQKIANSICQSLCQYSHFLTQGFTLWCPKCCTTDWNCSSQHDQTHWNGNILPIYGFISCWACVKELCSKRVQSQPGNIWVSPKISDDFLPIPRYFKYILQAFLGPAWRSGLHLQSQLQKLVTQEVRKSS